jgi:hypothetical protein
MSAATAIAPYTAQSTLRDVGIDDAWSADLMSLHARGARSGSSARSTGWPGCDALAYRILVGVHVGVPRHQNAVEAVPDLSEKPPLTCRNVCRADRI